MTFRENKRLTRKWIKTNSTLRPLSSAKVAEQAFSTMFSIAHIIGISIRCLVSVHITSGTTVVKEKKKLKMSTQINVSEFSVEA